jgi:hypothetical protein
MPGTGPIPLGGLVRSAVGQCSEAQVEHFEMSFRVSKLAMYTHALACMTSADTGLTPNVQPL